MQRKMLKSKIHRATVTDANLHYQGSITIDADLMDDGDIWEFERVDIWNVTNGNRFSTYALAGERGSGTICINGAAAHKASPGDLVIIASFAWMDEDEAQILRPRIIQVDRDNKAVRSEEKHFEDIRVVNMLM
jgi:aspartate 1-decarboxylase